MELNEIVNVLNETKNKIASIEDMISDYEKCSSEKSKQILLAAITKYTSEFKTSTAR